MRDFDHLFDRWAPVYDKTVYEEGGEYREVFEGYEQILHAIKEEIAPCRNVLEIGCGTGNLAKKLHESNFDVFCVEPSLEMRKAASTKVPDVEIVDGNFLNIPYERTFDAVVSSYAFHHLTYKEKQEAIAYLKTHLNPSGRIVTADTMFESKAYKEALLKHVEEESAQTLLDDLNHEYYEYLEDMVNMFEQAGFHVKKLKMNKYVWILTAKRGNDQ